jgi:hypothetical protein
VKRDEFIGRERPATVVPPPEPANRSDHEFDTGPSPSSTHPGPAVIIVPNVTFAGAVEAATPRQWRAIRAETHASRTAR